MNEEPSSHSRYKANRGARPQLFGKVAHGGKQPDFEPSILAAIEGGRVTAKRSRRARPSLRLWPWMATGAAAVVAIGVLFFRGRVPEQLSEQAAAIRTQASSPEREKAVSAAFNTSAPVVAAQVELSESPAVIETMPPAAPADPALKAAVAASSSAGATGYSQAAFHAEAPRPHHGHSAVAKAHGVGGQAAHSSSHAAFAASHGTVPKSKTVAKANPSIETDANYLSAVLPFYAGQR